MQPLPREEERAAYYTAIATNLLGLLTLGGLSMVKDAFMQIRQLNPQEHEAVIATCYQLLYNRKKKEPLQ